MKNDRLFSKDIIKNCEICANGRPSFNRTYIFCIKNGVMAPNGYCKSFKYDPLKRIPKAKGPSFDYKPEDFQI